MCAPSISVFMCNYNYGRFLGQCLAGVLRQTFTDFEIVITDDGSTDGSQNIIAQYAARDSRIKPVYFEKNQGVIAATKNVLSRVTGKLLFGQGTDDFTVDARFFERAIAALEQHPYAAGFYGVAGLLSAEQNKPVGMMGSAPRDGYVGPEDFYRGLLKGHIFVPGSSLIWRRDLFEAMGGYDYSLGPQIDYLVNHALPCRHGIVFAREAVTCQRIYEKQTNYGSKGSLWEVAARFALVEQHLRAVAPAYDGMEEDWNTWRAYWMIDAIQKTTGATWRKLNG
jgi:hypothetical protein